MNTNIWISKVNLIGLDFMELGSNKIVTTSWLLLVSVVTSGVGGGNGAVQRLLANSVDNKMN